MEITEDAEENAADNKEAPTQPVPGSATQERRSSQMSDATVVPPDTSSDAPQASNDDGAATITGGASMNDAASINRAPSINLRSETPVNDGTASIRAPSTRPVSQSSHRDHPDLVRTDSRISTQSARPSLRETGHTTTRKRKVKVGPRPSVDSNGRPRTAGSLSRGHEQRPVASLPAGMRTSSVRKPEPEQPRPRSQGSSLRPLSSRGAPPVPPLLVAPPSIPVSKPQLSPGAKSMGAMSTMSTLGTSQEKERLMKALQLRKKQMEKRAQSKNKDKAGEEKLNTIPDVNENKRPDDSTEKRVESKKVLATIADDVERKRNVGRTEERTQDSAAVPQTSEVDPTPSKSAKGKEPLREMHPPVEQTLAPASQIDPPEPEKETESTFILPATTYEGVQEEPVSQTKDNLPSNKSEEEESRARSPAEEGPAEIDASLERKVEVPPKSEKGSEPLPEINPAAVPSEPNKDAKPEASDMSKPDSAVDMMNSDSDGERSSNTSPPSTAATTSTDNQEIPASSKPAQETHEIEPQDSVISDESKISDGPSVSPDVPHGNKSPTPPETDLISSQSSAAPDRQTESDATDATEPSAVPDSPTSTLRPNSVVDPSTSIVTNDPSSQHDTPETSNTVSHAAEHKPKRKPQLEPIQVPTPDSSDDDNLSDDSFMEELSSATVEEAKPISVGKSPMVADFGSENGHDAWRSSRAVSNPATGRRPSLQAVTPGRSVSSPFYSEFGGPPTPVMMAKKVNVSSGISKRIKALEKFSSPDPPLNPNPSASAGPSRRASSAMGGNPDTLSISRQPSHSRDPSLQRPASELDNASRTPSSVSVTARIVRDPSANSGTTADTESKVVDLQPSQLTVEETSQATDTATESQRSRSMSSGGTARPSLSRMPRSDSGLSASARSKPDESTTNGVASTPDDKKESRTSRMFRRMSSIKSSSRRSLVGTTSPSVKEEEFTPTANGEAKHTAALNIGEVNIQFPDTLLWKRRFMQVDDKGYLVLAPGNSDSGNRNMVKRYHLSEFTTPCLPDEDRQELPNSILLDFLNGSTLQCACESRQGQESILRSKYPHLYTITHGD